MKKIKIKDFETWLIIFIAGGILLTSLGIYLIGSHNLANTGKISIIFGMFVFYVSIIIFVFKYA